MKTPNIPPAAEKARKEMQEHYDAQVFTRDLWETLHGKDLYPKQHELQTMLVRQLKKHQAAIRATITALRYGGDPLGLADRLERLL